MHITKYHYYYYHKNVLWNKKLLYFKRIFYLVPSYDINSNFDQTKKRQTVILYQVRSQIGDGGVMGAHAHLKKKLKRVSFSDANCFQTVKTVELPQGFAPPPPLRRPFCDRLGCKAVAAPLVSMTPVWQFLVAALYLPFSSSVSFYSILYDPAYST